MYLNHLRPENAPNGPEYCRTQIGRNTRRWDGPAKVSGTMEYPSDIYVPGMRHAAVLYSPYAHAKIVSVDTSEAEKMGAVCLTHEDIPDTVYNERSVSTPAGTYRDRTILPDRARHVGEPLMAVAAPTEELAFKALHALKVEYEVLPAVYDPEEAMKDGALAVLADRIQFSVNRDYAATQMLDSIKVGLSEMLKCDAFFVAPGDMPAISCTTYERLIDSYRIGQRSILFPTLDGYRKHPPLVDASYIPEILEFEGEGMRAFWRAHESEIREIAINDPGCWMDADHPEDLERIKAYLGNR